MSQFKILGQTPAAIVAAVEAVLALLLSLGVFGLTSEQSGGIVAIVTAVLALVVAYATKRTLLAATTGLVKAALMALATFGWALTEPQQTAFITAVALVGGLFIHETNSSLETPISKASPGTLLPRQ